MSGQHQTFSPGQQSYNPLPFSVPGIAGQLLRVRPDTWQVRATNQRTGQVRSITCTATSVEQAVFNTHHRIIDDDFECAFDPYEVTVKLLTGTRKLWNVLPIGQADAHSASVLNKPPLIGRVTSVDEDGAIQAAMSAFRLEEDEFDVLQV